MGPTMSPTDTHSHQHTAQLEFYCSAGLCPIHEPSPDLGLWVAEPPVLWKGGLEGQGLVEEL